MASVLALISKAVFMELPWWRAGEVPTLDRYQSKHPAFAKLGPGDALFLVTVLANELMLVAIIENARASRGAVVGDTNITPMADLMPVRQKLGFTAPIAKLAMSLQTPRVLDEDQIKILRGAAHKTVKLVRNPEPVRKMKVAPKRATPSTLKGGKPSARAKALLAQVYAAPGDRALRQVLADQLLEDQHVWGELIALQLAGKDKARAEQITTRHARDIVGNIVNIVTRRGMKFEDGFLVEAMTDKNKSFTSAPDRLRAAKAPEWATVRKVVFTYEAPSPFRHALLQNPASRNITTLAEGGYGSRATVLMTRAAPGAPLQIAHPDAADLLAGLSASDLARVPMPNVARLRAVLEAERSRRSTPKKKPRR